MFNSRLANSIIMNEIGPQGNNRLNAAELARLLSALDDPDGVELSVEKDGKPYSITAMPPRPEPHRSNIFVMITAKGGGTPIHMFFINPSDGTMPNARLGTGNKDEGLEIVRALISTIPQPPETPLDDVEKPFTKELPGQSGVMVSFRNLFRRIKL